MMKKKKRAKKNWSMAKRESPTLTTWASDLTSTGQLLNILILFF